jgi:hypothetical protein
MKKYTDNERPEDAQCYDCGLSYDKCGDCTVPNDIWEQINPTYHTGAGILCPNCMLQRLHELGISNVPAIFY